MEQFDNDVKSHEHSLTVLNQLIQYDNFLEGIESVADMGCGGGYDIAWWASLESPFDDPPVPFNYQCYAIDIDTKKINATLPDNVHVIEANFENKVLPKPVDFMWSHNSFQYALNPLNTLKLWNQQLNENGMLYICVPAQQHIKNNHLIKTSAHYQYFNHTLTNLVYMLAVNGFDCNDAYFLKEPGDPWIHAAVYKTGIEPMDPRTTSWHDLDKLNLLNPSMRESLLRYGTVREDNLIFLWLDRSWHFCKD